MTLINNGVNTSLIDFNDLPWSSKARFTLKRGAESTKVGKDGVVNVNSYERQVKSDLNIDLMDLKPLQHDRVKEIINILKTNVNSIPLNDFSDNFVFNWDFQGVKQYGKLVPIRGTTDSYRGVKYYQAGKNIGIRPIYYYPEEATVEVSENGVTLDKNTGIFNSSSDVSGVFFTCDLYYTLYHIKQTIDFTHRYGRGADFGFNSSVPIVNEANGTQQFYGSITFEETIVNELLDLPVFLRDESAADLDYIELQGYTRGSSIGVRHTVPKVSNRGISYRKSVTSQDSVKLITIPGNAVKHRELIYYSTLFRACSGGSLTITT